MARASRAEWAKRVERWQDSGLTAKEFANELNVAPTSLTFWKWKLKQPALARATRKARRKPEQREQQDAVPTARFVQLITAPSAPAASGGLEVVFANGAAVRIPNDFDETTLVRLVAVLGGR